MIEIAATVSALATFALPTANLLFADNEGRNRLIFVEHPHTSSLPNVKGEPRAAAHKRLSSSENAGSSGSPMCETAGPVSALALAAGWAFLSFFHEFYL